MIFRHEEKLIIFMGLMKEDYEFETFRATSISKRKECREGSTQYFKIHYCPWQFWMNITKQHFNNTKSSAKYIPMKKKLSIGIYYYCQYKDAMWDIPQNHGNKED